MKESLRQQALALGFDDCRFTTAAPPTSAEHFQTWLAEKRHGEMVWLERNAPKRVDPRLVLPGANSIITLAVSYARPETGDSEARSAAGIVARYAQFNDYHDVLGERLKTLAVFVDQIGQTQTRSLWYVDTGPILERDYAQRAGMGFVGKHTNLISRRLGNWIFLAEILTTLELEPDAPEQNHCGKCTRCIESCPTNAITGPFQLDARRCISYLTIELKGSIPIEFRPLIGSRIYGCDDCLAACPWNKFARAGNLLSANARTDLNQPDLLRLLELDDAGFKTKFRNSPILRTKRRGFLRNVCVALGNVGDKSALPFLGKSAKDHEPLIAEHARWAMEQILARSQTVTPASP